MLLAAKMVASANKRLDEQATEKDARPAVQKKNCKNTMWNILHRIRSFILHLERKSIRLILV